MSDRIGVINITRNNMPFIPKKTLHSLLYTRNYTFKQRIFKHVLKRQPMILLDKWTLTDTLAILSHPERRTTPEIHPRCKSASKEKSSLRQKAHEETQRRAYANAYKELQDEISMLQHEKHNIQGLFSIE